MLGLILRGGRDLGCKVQSLEFTVRGLGFGGSGFGGLGLRV